MKKTLSLVFSFFLLCYSYSQDTEKQSYIRRPALGISFLFNDYTTAQRIRASTLSSVLANKQKAKFNEMESGIAISYFKGLNNNLDLATTLAGSFADYPVGSENSIDSKLIFEGDVSINIKLLSEQYWLTPFASVGAGISKYGSYWGALIPVGLGLKLNLFDEAHFFYNTQYRIPVTTNTSNYHFMHSIGIAGVIGK
jgi:OOP family OmpA-OmpF porin